VCNFRRRTCNSGRPVASLQGSLRRRIVIASGVASVGYRALRNSRGISSDLVDDVWAVNAAKAHLQYPEPGAAMESSCIKGGPPFPFASLAWRRPKLPPDCPSINATPSGNFFASAEFGRNYLRITGAAGRPQSPFGREKAHSSPSQPPVPLHPLDSRYQAARSQQRMPCKTRIIEGSDARISAFPLLARKPPARASRERNSGHSLWPNAANSRVLPHKGSLNMLRQSSFGPDISIAHPSRLRL